jgi:hypothetical protein
MAEIEAYFKTSHKQSLIAGRYILEKAWHGTHLHLQRTAASTTIYRNKKKK